MSSWDDIQHRQLPLIRRGVEVLVDELGRQVDQAIATERELQGVVDLINKTLNGHIIASSIESIVQHEADEANKRMMM